ncbi:EamA family transporter [Cryobacterium sp. CG_9.6]|uniref:DMT family transporter n=1 Tax=Cryobacterium sp. CG_9.6 TaxID=2760710 RepID=UPI0024753528|nr:EamA family transporter [Cryobacterium sp. CG_9.6]MDH6237798.1 DME family drug/metabolite transporter [Cryobacterium sp. CG_9.6]
MTTRGSIVLIVIAAVCFGTTGTAQALGGSEASATSLGAARIVGGGVLLALVAAFAERARRRPGVQRVRWPAGRSSMSAGVLVLLGACGVAGYQPTFFTGTAQNGVAVGTLVALGCAPVLTGLLEWAVRGRAPGIRWAIATSVAALGIAVLSGLGTGGAMTLTLPGLAASLGAAGCYAVYTVTTKLLLDRGWSPALAMGTTFGVAAALSLPVLLSTNLEWMSRPAGLVTVAWLAVVTTALAYTLFGRGLRALPAAQVATLTLLEPVTATLLGVLVLQEVFTLSTAAGVLLLVAGLVILTARVPRVGRPAMT